MFLHSRHIAVAGFQLVFFVGIVRAQSQDAWTRADSAIVRARPSAFGKLPAPIRRDLERRGCTVPQQFDDKKLNNVISGAFVGPRRIDWAVLCSIAGRSRVLIYPAGGAQPADSLDEAPDASFLQRYTQGIVYSRAITTVPAKRVRRLIPARGAGNASRHADHDAIEIAFVDKASSVFYWTGAKWIELGGSD